MAVATAAPGPAARRPLDWEAPPSPYPARDRIALVALVTVPALLVVLVVAVFTGIWWLAAASTIAWAAKLWLDARSRDPLMLRRLQARPAQGAEAARLRNIAAGLAADLGVAVPELQVIPAGGPNALVRNGGPGGVIAVTSSLLASYTRTEIEAVVAHCLMRLHSADFVHSNLAARWSDLGAGLAPRVGLADDVRAAALTRYPPALVSALEKADPRIKRYAPLWFAADAPSHEPTARRVAAVTDL